MNGNGKPPPQPPPPLPLSPFDPRDEPSPYRRVRFPASTGLLVPGNINLTTRPVVHTPEGPATVRSISFGEDGREVLVPTVSDDGRIMSDDEAIQNYRKTGRHLGIFRNPQSATVYAQELHRMYEAGEIPGYPKANTYGSPDSRYDPEEVRRRLAELGGTPLLPELSQPPSDPLQETGTRQYVHPFLRSLMDELAGRTYGLVRPLTSPTNLAILGGTAVAPELAPFASRAFGLGMGTVGLHEAEQGKYPEAAVNLGLGTLGLAAPSVAGARGEPGMQVPLLKGEGGFAEFRKPPTTPPVSPTVSPFYSQLEKVIEAKMPNVTTVDQLQGILKDPRIKVSELEATGLQNWMNTLRGSTQKVTKDEVRRQLALGKVELKDVDYGKGASPEDMAEYTRLQKEYDEIVALRQRPPVMTQAGWDERNALVNRQIDIERRMNVLEQQSQDYQPKYNRPDLVLPGGSRYREKLLVMPGGTERTEWKVTDQYGRERRTFPTQGQAEIWANQTWGIVGEPLHPATKIEPVVVREPLYTEPHFDVSNVVAHGRFTDRTTTAGEPMLFGEELQSQAALDVRKAEAKGEPSPWKGFPFEKNWHELMLWRALRMAAEEGKTRFGWTTGEQQIARYDLSKRISRLETTRGYAPGEGNKPYTFYHVKAHGPVAEPSQWTVPVFDKTVPENELADYVGAELAAKIINNTDKAQTYSGLDLRVGGEGKRQLYDQMLVQAANRIGKRYGIKTEDVQVPTGRPKEGMAGRAVGPEIVGPEGRRMEVFTAHSLQITPDLYQALMGEGRPLFQSPLPFLVGGAGAALAAGAAATKGKAEEKAGSGKRPVPSGPAEYEYDRATGKVRRVK